MPRTPRAPRVNLVVTEEMIKDAIPRDSSYCVFAEAVKAAWPGARKVAVDLQTIRFTDPDKGLRYTYLTPRPCQVAIINFDQGTLPQAFSIQLRNGQVTAAALGQVKMGRTQRIQTEASLKANKENAAKAREHKATLTSLTGAARLAQRARGVVPDKIGGKTPPIAMGRRRAFGLRSLER